MGRRRTLLWPSEDRIREALEYNQNTGEFTWKVDTGFHNLRGARAGTRDSRGYRQIRIDGVTMREHRLAWLLVHGCWPTDQIDHINGNPSDNRIANLREADGFQNHQNEKLAKGSKSGHTGVVFHAGKWVASLFVHGRYIYCGRHTNLEDAVKARRQAKLRYCEFQPYDRCDSAASRPSIARCGAISKS